ncbi:hypothetical protein NPIL_123241 [Nephila pilipes]|uniref:Uncharacterized protein n=1 Tax=Nephila pilipes TaxID=299642 RepID=A0A8X6I3G2_NEPPI|nr:hypothetical protein NPIL_123241 [Nephila pilipes]
MCVCPVPLTSPSHRHQKGHLSGSADQCVYISAQITCLGKCHRVVTYRPHALFFKNRIVKTHLFIQSVFASTTHVTRVGLELDSPHRTRHLSRRSQNVSSIPPYASRCGEAFFLREPSFSIPGKKHTTYTIVNRAVAMRVGDNNGQKSFVRCKSDNER